MLPCSGTTIASLCGPTPGPDQARGPAGSPRAACRGGVLSVAPATVTAMARSTAAATYECSECGWRSAKWVGRCGECQAWGSVAEARSSARTAAPGLARVPLQAGAPRGPAVPIGQVDAETARARPTGMDELDRVLGGGLVPGGVVLLAGEPGVGKSTLLLEAGALAARSGPVLYVTGEESAAQVRQRADRIGAISDNLYLAAETDFGALLAHVEAVDPSLLIVDSVQTISAAGVEGVPGGVTQVREVTAALTGLAKQRTLTTVLVGHVTKDGSVAGPRTLEHLVDVVLSFDGDSRGQLRMVRALKNRFGPTDEIGCFELGEFGLIGLPDPSGLFLSRQHEPVPGTCVTVTMEGRRPLVAEVQTLLGRVVEPPEQTRWVTSGLDSARVGMVVAVLRSRSDMKIKRQDIYAATVGGVRLTEPSVDLALAVALASATANISVPPDVVAIGEVGLAGEIRKVTATARRLTEAQRLGFRRAIVPVGSDIAAGLPMEVEECSDVRSAIAVAIGG
jgi:DNA repair protein RadA/Sms